MYKHKDFLASTGINGWYELVENNEIIEFDYPVNSILIESSDETLGLRLNKRDNDWYKNVWYIEAGAKEGIEGLTVSKMQIMNPSGTRIRWKALQA